MQHKYSMMRVVALSLSVLSLGLIAWYASQYKFLSECRISKTVAGVIMEGKVVYEPGECLSYRNREHVLALNILKRADRFASYFESLHSVQDLTRLIVDIDRSNIYAFEYRNSVVVIGEKLLGDDFSFELALSKAWSSKMKEVESLEPLAHELVVLAYRGYSRTGPLNIFVVELDALEDYPTWSELCLLDLVPREKMDLCAGMIEASVVDSEIMAQKHDVLRYLIAYRFLMKSYFSLSPFERNSELRRWLSELKGRTNESLSETSIETRRDLRNSVVSQVWKVNIGKMGESAVKKALVWLDPSDKFDSKLDFALSSFKE